MHENYDEDDGYSDDDYDHDYKKDPYQWYYKFDVGPDTPISMWFVDMLNKWIHPDSLKDLNGGWELFSIPGFKSQKFPVNSWNPNTANNKFQYLGSNYQGNPIWKSKYFAIDKIDNQYKLHLQNHAKHFIQQPHYYNGMFDILN